MPGPFSTSLRAKLHGLSVFLIVPMIVLAGLAAGYGFREASRQGMAMVETFAQPSTAIVATEVVRNRESAALVAALQRTFDPAHSPVQYAVAKTATGEVVAASLPGLERIPVAAWKPLADRRIGEVGIQSCVSVPLHSLASFTAPVTNILWNLADPQVRCHGRRVRSTEIVSLNRLPGALSGRTILPLTEAYLVAGLIELGLLVALVAVLLMALYVHQRIVGPIRVIKDGALIMAQGNLGHHIRISNRDEIGVVANFINEVGRNLQRVREELIDRQRIASELDAAAKIQSHLLPSELPTVPGLDIAARTRPSTEVGGDNYDFMQIDEENLIFFVGDVTGHGVPAGLVMIMIDVLIDTFSSMHTSPKDILVNVNRILTPNIDSTMYMTMLMFGFNIKTQRLRYTSAGHEHIIHYHAATRRCTVTRSGGIALGMIPDIEHLLKEQEIPLERGDAIILYSDGITEAYGGPDGKEMFGLGLLVQHVEKVGYRDAQGIFDHVTRALADFMGGAPQNDDITLMVLKYVGASQDDIAKASKRIKLSVAEGERKATGTKRWDWDKKPKLQ